MVAVVIMLVLMMLGLSLLLVSFSLFSTASRQQNLYQSRELAQTISQQLTAEITVDTPETGKEADYPIWNYLKENISIVDNAKAVPSKWPYYEEGKYRHEKKDAFRYFQLDSTALTGVAGDVQSETEELLQNVEIIMYWESNNTDADVSLGDAEDGIMLTVIVTCKDNKEETTITTQYELNVDTANGNAWTWRKEYEEI